MLQRSTSKHLIFDIVQFFRFIYTNHSSREGLLLTMSIPSNLLDQTAIEINRFVRSVPSYGPNKNLTIAMIYANCLQQEWFSFNAIHKACVSLHV